MAELGAQRILALSPPELPQRLTVHASPTGKAWVLRSSRTPFAPPTRRLTHSLACPRALRRC